MESCRFCGKEIKDELTFCDAECTFRFFAFNHPKTEEDIEQRNRAMEEIIRLYRAMQKNMKDGTIDLDLIFRNRSEEQAKPGSLRLVLEVIEGQIEKAYCTYGPVEILIAEHGGSGNQIHLPRGKPPGPLVSPFIFDALEVKLNAEFVQETFRRAKE